MANGGEAGAGWWRRVRRTLGLAEANGPAFRQEAKVDGEGNIVVQAINSTVEIGTGKVRLVLERRHAILREVKSEVDLLRPEVAATALVGREKEIAYLQGWLDSADPISVHAIVARGGSGKTRLGLKLCELAEASAWDAGFVSADELSRFAMMERLGDWNPTNDMLVVVDYAARSARAVNKILRALAGQATPNHKLRMLLLERHGDSESGWWIELRRTTGSSDDAFLDWFTEQLPTALAAVDAIEDRRAIVRGTLEAMVAKGLATEVPSPPAIHVDTAFDKALVEDLADREPLYLMMAALFGASNGVVYSLALGRLDLALWLAIVERDRLKALAKNNGVNDTLLPHLVARITLSRGLPAHKLADVIVEERAALRVESGVALEQVVATVRDALPSRMIADGESLGFLEPDVLGETFCLLLLSQYSTNDQSAVVRRCAATSIRGTAMQLVLIVQDYARELPLSPTRTALARRHLEFSKLPGWLARANPALGWLRQLAETTNNPLDLVEIADQIPPRTLILREVASEIMADFVRVIEAVPYQERARDHLNLPYARALSILGNRLSDLGRREEALTAAQKAVSIFRTLATDHPDEFHSYLAGALENLGILLSALGRTEEALEATIECVDIRRSLVHGKSKANYSDFARSLHNLSRRLNALGRREPALGAATEAVSTLRHLAHDRPDEFAPELAESVDGLGIMLSGLGQHEEALAHICEGLEIRRKLAHALPDAFQPDLARSLHNLGNVLNALRRWPAALSAAEEAVAVYRILADHRPAAFLPVLASSLSNVGGLLFNLNRWEAALVAADEAVSVFRALAEERPSVFLPELAGSLNNLGAIASVLGKTGLALAAAQEAVSIYRDLAESRPETYLPDLAMSLGAQGSIHGNLGNHEAAHAAYAEGLYLLRPTFLMTPQVVASLVRGLADNYLISCAEFGREPDMALLAPIMAKLKELKQSEPARGN